MKQVTVTAPTVKQAIESALRQLNTIESNVDVHVIDAGKKGFIGLGSRLAIVRVTKKNTSVLEMVDSVVKTPEIVADPDPVEEGKQSVVHDTNDSKPEVVIDKVKQQDSANLAKAFIIDVAAKMGVPIEVEMSFEGKYCSIKMASEKIAILIGKRGQVLNSLQYLAQLVANKSSEQYITILLDAEDYRSRRNDTLVNLANKMADKATYSKREVALEPMPSYERKVIHAALMEKSSVKTYSTGTEPYRHIVIAPNI